MSGVSISLNLIGASFEAASKYHNGNKRIALVILKHDKTSTKFPDLDVFSGSDDLFLPLLKKGGVGCITAVGNIACNFWPVSITLGTMVMMRQRICKPN